MVSLTKKEQQLLGELLDCAIVHNSINPTDENVAEVAKQLYSGIARVYGENYTVTIDIEKNLKEHGLRATLILIMQSVKED